MKRLEPRLLVVASSIPPAATGGAVVLGRMFGGLDPRDYVLVTFEPAQTPLPREPLTAVTYRLDGCWDSTGGRPGYPLATVRGPRRFATEAIRRARQLVRIAKAESCGAVLVVSGGPPDLPAAALAAWMAGLPWIVWLQDRWRHQLAYIPGVPWIAGLLERAVLKGADAVVVPNEQLQDELRRDYGCAATLLRNPIDELFRGVDDDPALPWPLRPESPRIVYTGQVYAAQLDSVARLADALESPRLSGWTLHVHGSDVPMPSWLPQGNVVMHPVADQHSIRVVQRQADILFLPLAFASPYPEIIRTSSPTKLGEYLNAGRPILVHAPPDSYLARFARTHGIAVVVDKPAPELLVDAVIEIAEDLSLRSSLATRAQKAAGLFDQPQAVDEFHALMKDLLARPRR